MQPETEQTYIDVKCDAESHKCLTLDRFTYDSKRAAADKAAGNSSRGWRWEEDRNRGTHPGEPRNAAGLPRWILPPKRNTVVMLSDGRGHVSLDCPVCPLHLPTSWEKWVLYLEIERHAGKTEVLLPELVAKRTRSS